MSHTAIERVSPSLYERFVTFCRHGLKIMFLPYGETDGYTFDDLAACQDSLDGQAFQSIAQRMRSDKVGARILRERPKISLDSVDWDYLSRLDTDTLGYNFWHHLHANDIMQDVKLGPPKVKYDADTEYAKARYRETHDLRHVILGLGIRGQDEVVLQTFQYAQQPQVLSAGIVLGGALKHVVLEGNWSQAVPKMKKAYVVGKSGRFLSNIYFEEMWEWPLEAVREVCGIDAVDNTYPVKERAESAPSPFNRLRIAI